MSQLSSSRCTSFACDATDGRDTSRCRLRYGRCSPNERRTTSRSQLANAQPTVKDPVMMDLEAHP